MSDSTIHISVPRETKGRWIRASRAAGKRLSDYITEAVEAYMKQQLANIQIPSDLDFSSLKLARDSDGHVSFDWSPIERICAASDLAPEILKEGPEDNVCGLIVAWYQAHRQQGGPIDPVAEDLLAEGMAEDAAGSASFPPGRA